MTSSNYQSVNNHLSKVLKQFSKRYISNYQKNHSELPKIEHDKQWSSPCEQGVIEEGYISWQPVEVTTTAGLTFENVESALEITLHPDIKTYFTTIYSDQLDAKSEDGELSLLFAWNKDDFQRLQENLIGHVLMKRKLKQAETIFFAVTDEEDMIISLDNDTGEVWVEQVGCKPHKKLTNSLAEFIDNLTPVTN